MNNRVIPLQLVDFRNFYLDIVLFLISPVLSLYVSFKNLTYNRRSIYIIGAFFCLFGSFLPPSQDAYRYREMYYDTSDVTIRLFSEEGKDFLLPLLMRLFNYLGFSFENFRFVLLLFCYVLWIQIFLFFIDRFYFSKKNYALLVVCMLFCIRIYSLSYGIRFAVASIFFIYSFFLFFFVRKRFKSFTFLLLALCMHFSIILMILLFPVTFLLKCLRVSFKKKVLYILLLTPIISSALTDTVELFSVMTGNEFMSGYANAYIEGTWGTNEMLSWLSFNGLCYTFGRILPLLFIIAFCCCFNCNSFLANFFLSTLLLLEISLSSLSLILRFSNISIMLGFILILCNIKNISMQLMKMKILSFSFVFVFILYSYAMRDDLINGKQYKAILCPISTFFTDQYPDTWVREKLHLDGIFVNSTMDH